MVELSPPNRSHPPFRNQQVPPLENGDRLTRHEFERRYAAAPDIEKAELIEGVVYLASPLRYRSHARPHSQLILWLGTYEVNTSGVELSIEPTVRLDEDNDPQPDGVLLIPQPLGGQSRLTEDDYIERAPELVAEIAASSAAIDLHAKKTAYRRNGVQEYIVWQIFENKLDWFSLQQGEYVLLSTDPDEVIKSRVFPGLWLAVSALLQSEMQQVLATLQQGLDSAEHKAFIRGLREL